VTDTTEPIAPRRAEARSYSTRDPRSVGDRPGANQHDLGSFNEVAIIETIRQAGTISRTEIAERTGLTQQSVSRILRVLLERGLLAEGEQQRTERLGKPRTPVRLRPEAAHAAGILVDPEVISVVLVDLDGRVLEHRSVRLDHEVSPTGLVEFIATQVEEVLEAAAVDRTTFLGVGVAVPGPITGDGSLLDLPLSKVWRNVPLERMLEERLPYPVVVEKDGTAAAVGERWLGRTSRSTDFAYLYFGTGMGSGLVLNGEAFRGMSGNAGEFGQLCAVRLGRVDGDGRPELVRECNPTVAIPEIARELGYDGPARTYREFCAEIATGDETVIAAVQQVADVIALGAAALIDLLDLPMVVVGGPTFEPELRDLVMETIDRAVNTFPTAHRARHVSVERSVVSGEAGAVGAASTIFHASFAPVVRRTRPYDLR